MFDKKTKIVPWALQQKPGTPRTVYINSEFYKKSYQKTKL